MYKLPIYLVYCFDDLTKVYCIRELNFKDNPSYKIVKAQFNFRLQMCYKFIQFFAFYVCSTFKL